MFELQWNDTECHWEVVTDERVRVAAARSHAEAQMLCQWANRELNEGLDVATIEQALGTVALA